MKLFGIRSPAPGWIGLAIEGDRIRLAKLLRDGPGRPRVERLLETARGDDLVADLRRLRKEAACGRCPCVLTLPSTDYQTLQIEAPEVPRQELAQAVRWRIKDMLTIPLDSAVVDALMLPQVSGLGARGRHAMAVSAERAAVERLAAPFVEAGWTVGAVDIPELAQRNVAALCEEENRGLAFLNLLADGGLLTLNWGGELFAFRRIETGSRLWTGADDERRLAAFDRISLELQRSLDYFDRQFSYVPVNKLVLAGGPELVHLAEYLRRNLYLPVELFDPAAVMDLPADGGTPACDALAVIGAALRCGEDGR